MSGFERQFPQSPEQSKLNENQQLPNFGTPALLQELPNLPTRPSTADPYIPVLQLEDFAGAGRQSNSPLSNITNQFPGAQRAEWTVAVDLTANAIVNNGKVIYQSHKEEDLQKLLEASKGRPEVAIVVQAENSLPSDATTQQKNEQLNRYVIRDGKLSNLETVDSQGMDANQTDLLKFATEVAPSNHIGMVIQSHGMGADGLVGDAGPESLNQLSDAIRTGLNGSGHDRLDLLDFDSCSMSSAAALGAVNSVADNVVASELRERASKNFGGQNLNAALANLLQTPQISPADLGKVFVERANQGSQPEVLDGDPFKHVGADVLTSYNSAKYGQFTAALDELGAKLSNAAQNENTRREIEKLIDKTSLLPGNANFIERRDLGEFVSSLKAAAENGDLPDDGGSISRAAGSVLDAQEQMTEAGRKPNLPGYEMLSGMYVFLPVKNFRDGTADGPTGLHRLEQIAERKPADKNQVIGMLEQVSNFTLENLSDSSKLQFKPVLDAIGNAKNARSDADFAQALSGLSNTVKGLMDTDVEKELRNNLMQKDDVPLCNQWNQFTHSFAPVG